MAATQRQQETSNIPPGFMGPQSKFKQFGLGEFSHRDGSINMQDADGNVLKIQLGYTNPMKTTCTLLNPSTKEDRSECVFIQADDQQHIITYHVTVPTPGCWMFKIFALPAADPGKQLAGVYNYVINCVKVTKKPYKAPKKYTGWKDGCCLLEPMFVHKDETGPTVPFKVKVPGATKVAVEVADEWTQLTSDGQYWCGNVFLGKYYGRNVSANLSASYGGQGDSYDVLLEYEGL